jgi:hypothetical protein
LSKIRHFLWLAFIFCFSCFGCLLWTFLCVHCTATRGSGSCESRFLGCSLASHLHTCTTFTLLWALQMVWHFSCQLFLIFLFGFIYAFVSEVVNLCVSSIPVVNQYYYFRYTCLIISVTH